MFIDKVALLLTIVGALNWGSIGLFGFDLVAFLCGGQAAAISRIIYTLVGLAGVWCTFPVTEALVAVMGVLFFIRAKKRPASMAGA